MMNDNNRNFINETERSLQNDLIFLCELTIANQECNFFVSIFNAFKNTIETMLTDYILANVLYCSCYFFPKVRFIKFLVSNSFANNLRRLI